MRYVAWLLALSSLAVGVVQVLPVPIPKDNPQTSEKIALGRKLFYDPILSSDNTLSCSSCHKQEFAFADRVSISPGVEGRLGVRNSPSLTNTAFKKSYFWEGGSPSLELQAMGPITAHAEMDSTPEAIVLKLKQHPQYPQLFDQVFGRSPDMVAVVQALASFQRTLISFNSDYDQFLAGKDTALTAREQRGLDLFFDKAECFHCHTGQNFSDESLHNTAIKIFDEDTGLERITGLESDIGKFKTPTLRNIAFTAPYMHDGSFATLKEVVEHYNDGGLPNLNADPLMRPLGLSDEEMDDLVAFLGTLSDDSFVQNPAFSAPKENP